MQRYLKQKIYLFASAIGGIFIIAGVVAGITIVVNGNNKVEFGVGSAPVNACDPDVTVNIIVERFNENQYLTGFTYSYVDKPACVGYDIETRFISANDQAKNLFATSTLASDPTVIRVFSTSSTSNWQLGKGAFSGLDANVIQLSSSSFQVNFVTPVLLASELGRILTAEIPHLPLGTFTGTARTIDLKKSWVAVSTNSDASSFYIADEGNTSGTGHVYKSNQAFTSFTVSSLETITALPNGSTGDRWSWLSQSDSGKYVAAVGGGQRVYFTQDYGSNWESRTTSSYYTRGTSTGRGPVALSADGSIVCLVSSAQNDTAPNSGGSTVSIWTNYKFYSKNVSPDFKLDSKAYISVRDCAISADNQYLFLMTSNNLYRYTISSLSAGPNNLSGGLLSNSPNVYRFGISETGKFVVIGELFNNGAGVENQLPRWRYSSDFGNTFSNSGGILYSTNRDIGQITVSRDGAYVATAIYTAGGAGGIITSNDFGKTFASSSLANTPVYSIAASTNGTRIIGGARYNPFVIYFVTSD